MALQELRYQLKCMLPLEPQAAECEERLLEAAAAEDGDAIRIPGLQSPQTLLRQTVFSLF